MIVGSSAANDARPRLGTTAQDFSVGNGYTIYNNQFNASQPVAYISGGSGHSNFHTGVGDGTYGPVDARILSVGATYDNTKYALWAGGGNSTGGSGMNHHIFSVRNDGEVKLWNEHRGGTTRLFLKANSGQTTDLVRVEGDRYLHQIQNYQQAILLKK